MNRPDPILILHESNKARWPEGVWAIWREWSAGHPEEPPGYEVYWTGPDGHETLYLDPKTGKWDEERENRNACRSPVFPFFRTLKDVSKAIKTAGRPKGKT